MATPNIQAKVIDTTFYSIGFPEDKNENLISRDNYLSQVDDYFKQGIKVVFIDGESDSGKTSLCGQYAKMYPNEVISVFFNPFNNIDYNLDYYCTNIVYQLKYLLNEKFELETQTTFGIEQYQQYIFNFRKNSKRGNKSVSIVIDGLEDKLKEKSDFIRDLVMLLPIGSEPFRIVIVGSEQDFKNLYNKGKNLNTKSITLTGFSELEIIKYLELSDNSNLINKDIYKITKGLPGRLRTLKSLIKSNNYTLDKITTTTTYKSWLELDCSIIDITVPSINAILSLFALTEKSYTIEECSKICIISPEELKRTIENVKVLVETQKHYQFVSSSHKKYFSNLLRGNKKKVQDLLINYYGSEDNINSLIELPKLYVENNDWQKVLGILDDNYSQKIIQSTESIKNVTDGLALGILASEKMNRYTEIWRYSLEGSIVNELDNFLFWESEVKARISIHDFTGAIALAESAILKVDRLKLLALIARWQKEIKNSVDEDLVKLISQLYETVDLVTVGDKIYDIVADLIYAMPNLAIEIIEKSSGKSSERNINDWVVAKLSVAAIDSSIKNKEDIANSKKIEVLQTLNNPEVKKINKAISFLVGNYSSSKVITEVAKLSDSTERLRLLRLWLANTKSNENDIASVINLALDELINSTSDSSVTLDTLRELSQQLPFVKDLKIKDKLYYRFKNIENGLADLGMKNNRYSYELNLFHTEFTLDRKNAVDSLNRILTEIDNISDVLIRLEAYAEAYYKLAILDYTPFSKKINFVYSRILELTKKLFDETGSHLKLSKYFLKTISKKNPILGIKICDQINLQFRREEAKTLILESYLDNNLKFISLNILKEIENSFDFGYSREQLSISVLERFSEAKSLHFNIIKDLFYYFEKIKSFKTPQLKVFAYVLTYKIVSKNEEWQKRTGKRYESLIEQSWSEIEAEWERLDIGFNICADISKINPLFARNIFNKALTLKQTSWIDSSLVAESYLNSMRVVIRTFVALIITNKETSEDERVLTDLMNRIPSEVKRLDLWTELGFYCYIHENESFAKHIYNSHIVPLMDEITGRNLDLRPMLDSLTFIYLFHSEQAIKHLKYSDDIIKEQVYMNVSEFYITKKNPYEVYDSNVRDFLSTYTDLTKAIEVLKGVNTDVGLFIRIDLICRSIQVSKNSISRAQVLTLLNSLEDLTNAKLPDKKNIKHNGFKLLAEEKIMRLKKDSTNINKYWQSVINEASKIPNRSDLIFVNAILLNDIPFDKLNMGSSIKQKMYETTIIELNSISVHYEFIQRVIDVSEYMFSANRTQWKEIVSKAFTLCSNFQQGKEAFSSRKNLIDSMYRMDPDFAKELINLSDDEEIDERYSKQLKKHIEILEVAKKIKNNKTLADKERDNQFVILQAIDNALRSINSEKVTPKKIQDVSAFLPLGNKLPLHLVLPVYFYYLTNCSKVYKEKNLTGIVADLHTENFRKAVKSTNLIEILSNRKKSIEKSNRSFFDENNLITNKVINPGSREKAFAFIKEWMVDELEEFIVIADPYFEIKDLEILKVIKELKPNIDIDILGSRNGGDSNIEDKFKEYWSFISDEDPPFANITFCWIPENGNQTPFHDRWIITKGGGLRMGTSLNSLGGNKESELSIMTPSEAVNVKENILSEYLERRKRLFSNMKLAYKSFSL